MTDTIQTLWTHGALSVMECLCLTSFLKTGHTVHLYTYEEVQGVPKGVVVQDGNEIISQSFLDYRTFINNGTFADFFRYKLLLDKGGWWVDTDLVALKYFDFSSAYVFGCMGPYPYQDSAPKKRALRQPPRPKVMTEKDWPGGWVCNACMKVPSNSEVMSYMWHECLKFDPSTIRWSEDVGPKLLDKAVRKHGLHQSVLNTRHFHPVAPELVRDLIDPRVSWDFHSETYAVHLWNDMWCGRPNWEGKETWKITGCPPLMQSKTEVVLGSLYGNLVGKYL